MTNSLMESIQLAWHVVVRNWVVYRKDFLANVSPTLADPALMLMSLGVGLSPFINQVEGLTYAQYLVPGMVATTTLFTAFFESSYGFYVRMTYENVFKAMLTTPIGVREVVLGEFIWNSLRAAIMAGGVGLVLALLGLVINPAAVILFPLVGALVAVPCGAIGLLAAGKVRNINQFQTVYSFLIAPIFYVSGIFFPLPEGSLVAAVAQISPFHHGVRLLQMLAWGRVETGDLLYHLGLLLLFAVGLYLWADASIRRKLVT